MGYWNDRGTGFYLSAVVAEYDLPMHGVLLGTCSLQPTVRSKPDPDPEDLDVPDGTSQRPGPFLTMTAYCVL